MIVILGVVSLCCHCSMVIPSSSVCFLFFVATIFMQLCFFFFLSAFSHSHSISFLLTPVPIKSTVWYRQESYPRSLPVTALPSKPSFLPCDFLSALPVGPFIGTPAQLALASFPAWRLSHFPLNFQTVNSSTFTLSSFSHILSDAFCPKYVGSLIGALWFVFLVFGHLRVQKDH